MKYEKSCGAIIVEDNKVLLIKQIAGHWGFPKGHTEKGENEVQTALREIKEETNLDVKINEKYRYVERYSPKEGVEKEVVIFVAEKLGGETKPQEEEIQKIEWLDYNDALKKLTYNTSRRILKKAWNDLNKI